MPPAILSPGLRNMNMAPKNVAIIGSEYPFSNDAIVNVSVDPKDPTSPRIPISVREAKIQIKHD